MTKFPLKTAEKPASVPTPACSPLPCATMLELPIVSVKGRTLPLKRIVGKVCVKAGVAVAKVLNASHPLPQEVAVKNLAFAVVVVIGLLGLIQKTGSVLLAKLPLAACRVSAPRTVPV